MDDNSIQQSIADLKENINQARIVAAETTNPEILRELALFDDEKTREAVVSNANTPPEVLVQLGEEFPSQLLDNPVFPLLLLENPNFIKELPLFTLRSILKEKNVPDYILEQAADKADVGVQLALANNVKTSKSILNRLSQSRDSEVVEAVNLHVNFVGELTGGVEEKIEELVPKSIPDNYRVDDISLEVVAQICSIPEFVIKHWVQQPKYKDSFCRKLAVSLTTKPLVLKHLANYGDSRILRIVAENNRSSVETLRKLASEEQLEIVGTCLSRNTNTPSDVLEKLSNDKYEWVRVNVAKHPNTSLNLLEEITNDVDAGVVYTAKRTIEERQGKYSIEALYNPQTPASVLEKLIQEDPPAVARHPNTPAELLVELSQNAYERIREAVAENPNSPVSILEKLANDDHFLVRWRVSQNPNTPIDILFKKLARDTRVARTIAKQMSNKKLDSYLEAECILDIFAEYSNSSLETIVQKIAWEGGETARLFLARRFDLPTDLYAQLAETNELKVHEALAQNPNTPASTLDKLASIEKFEIREQAFRNPSLSKETVVRILCSKNASYFLKLNPDCLSRYLDSKASVINYYTDAKSSSMWTSYITLIQPEIAQKILQNKSNSGFWVERLAVAQNPKASQNILYKLTEDCNQLVRAAARDTLQNS